MFVATPLPLSASTLSIAPTGLLFVVTGLFHSEASQWFVSGAALQMCGDKPLGSVGKPLGCGDKPLACTDNPLGCDDKRLACTDKALAFDIKPLACPNN